MNLVRSDTPTMVTMVTIELFLHNIILKIVNCELCRKCMFHILFIIIIKHQIHTMLKIFTVTKIGYSNQSTTSLSGNINFVNIIFYTDKKY